MVDIKLRQWAEQALPAKSVEAGMFEQTIKVQYFTVALFRLGSFAK